MKKNNKGFSLVELIVVVLIMAIIATALTLAVTKYVAKSKRSADANTAGELITAIQTAVTDYEMGTGTLTGKTVEVDTGADDTWKGKSYDTADEAEDKIGKTIAESMQRAASSTTKLMSKVYPQEGFTVKAVIKDTDDATYTVRYNGEHSGVDPILAGTK
jgi:prepilin-type N-terminal cleavage/methylation domain-containing protein